MPLRHQYLALLISSVMLILGLWSGAHLFERNAQEPVSTLSESVTQTLTPTVSLRQSPLQEASPSGQAEHARIQATLSKLPLPFVENQGQLDANVAFYEPTLTRTVYVTQARKLVYALPQTEEGGWTLVEEPVGATPQVRAGPVVESRVSSFIGNGPARWPSKIATYHHVALGEPWLDVRLTVQARGQQVEKLFTLAPGVSADVIQMQMHGTQNLAVAEDGSLQVTTGRGDVRFTAPLAWQDIAGERRTVAVAYRQIAEDCYGFTFVKHVTSKR
jgi:hypothetical protein